MPQYGAKVVRDIWRYIRHCEERIVSVHRWFVKRT